MLTDLVVIDHYLTDGKVNTLPVEWVVLKTFKCRGYFGNLWNICHSRIGYLLDIWISSYCRWYWHTYCTMLSVGIGHWSTRAGFWLIVDDYDRREYCGPVGSAFSDRRQGCTAVLAKLMINHSKVDSEIVK